MTIKTTIGDGFGKNGEAAVISRRSKKPGLVTYQLPYYNSTGQTKALVNATYGADMNVDASFGGTPENVHNGIDNAYWTASALSGTWTFDSTDQAFAGTRSVDASATVNNDEAQFEDGGSIDTDNYGFLSGHIYIDGWANDNKNVEIELRNAGTLQGTAIQLSDYIDTGTTGAWQTFTIPIDAFAASGATINQIVVRTISAGGGQAPNYYLDAIDFQQTGGATWTVEPDDNSIYEISRIQLTFADAFAGTLTDGTMPRLPYNTILGQAALSNGIVIQLTVNNQVQFNGTFSQLIDFVALPGLQVQSGSDGTNTWLQLDVPLDPPAVMDSRDKDKFEITISENLTGLLYFRTFVRGGKIELDPPDGEN